MLYSKSSPSRSSLRASAWRSNPSRGIQLHHRRDAIDGDHGDLRAGSIATPPQCAPPMLDGITSVPLTSGGVKIPSLRSGCNGGSAGRAIGLGNPAPSSTVNRCGLSGGNHAVVNGWVRDATSCGIPLAGTGPFFHRKDRSPSRAIEHEEHARSSSAYATTARREPPRVMVASAGGEALS